MRIKNKIIKNQNLKENEIVKNIITKKPDLSKLLGLFKFKRPIKEIMKEIKEGYDQDW